jgi:GT2 family glycosyltransferase
MAMSKSNEPLVSIVVLSFNRRKNVEYLMKALYQQDYNNYEIIVVDNDSQDGTAEFLAQNYPEIKTIRCPENLGLVAYNFGFSNAQGDYIIIIDDDGLPASVDWISRTVFHFKSNPNLGAIGYTIRMRDTGLLAYDSPNFDHASGSAGEFPSASFNGTGAALRVKALKDVGYYPFYFFRSWCELHLCTRLIDNGWRVVYVPDLEVWHCRPSGSINRPITYYGLRNYFWYIWSFYPWPHVLTETFHYTGSRILSVFQGKLPINLFLLASIHAFIRWRQYALDRKPISNTTLESLQRIRESGNDHGIVDNYRSFEDTYSGLLIKTLE